MSRKKLVIANDGNVDESKLSLFVNELRNNIAKWDILTKEEVFVMNDTELHNLYARKLLSMRVLTILHETKVIDLGVKS